MRWLSILLALLAWPALAADPAMNERVFDRAWSITGRRYWDRAMHGLDWAAERDRFRPLAREAADTRALYAVTNRMLDRLKDSHVHASPPADHAGRSAAGPGGLGFDAYLAGDAWLIRAVDPNGPAARAGMRIGWRLLSVDGREPDSDDRFGIGDRAMLMLEDEAGGRHALALTGAPLPPEQGRRARDLGDGVALLAFDQFIPGEDRWIARQIRDRPDLRGLILDMRENGGGDADVLDRVAGLFVADRQVVLRLSGRRAGTERTRGRGLWRGPLVLLTGPRTASAAEALAAFFDRAGRATTVGERTAGRLTAGVDHRLPDGGRLTVAEHDVRTADGLRLEGVGLPPRVPVATTMADLRAGRDPVLARARALLDADQPAGGGITISPPSAR